MIRNKKNHNNGLVAGMAGGILAVYLVLKLNPDAWWKELLVIAVSGVSFFLIISRLLKSTKWGTVGTVTVFTLLLLNRFEVLDLLTVALLIIIMGLISLIY
jgi:hypothetical protein